MIDIELATLEDIIQEFVRRGDKAIIIRWNVANEKKVDAAMTKGIEPELLASTLVGFAKKVAPHMFSDQPRKPPDSSPESPDPTPPPS